MLIANQGAAAVTATTLTVDAVVKTVDVADAVKECDCPCELPKDVRDRDAAEFMLQLSGTVTLDRSVSSPAEHVTVRYSLGPRDKARGLRWWRFTWSFLMPLVFFLVWGGATGAAVAFGFNFTRRGAQRKMVLEQSTQGYPAEAEKEDVELQTPYGGVQAAVASEPEPQVSTHNPYATTSDDKPQVSTYNPYATASDDEEDPYR